MTALLPLRVDRVRDPWPLPVDGTVLTARGATARDLPSVALMHSRCSAKTLLDRYRSGGRPPAIVVLDRLVRDPLSFVLAADDGRVVAVAHLADDPDHSYGSAEISLLVEDAWQRLGIGRRLLRHTAAAAALAGYRQLIGYPGTTVGTVHRMAAAIGTTRVLADPQRHLHTALPPDARRGLGPLQFVTGTPAAASITG